MNKIDVYGSVGLLMCVLCVGCVGGGAGAVMEADALMHYDTDRDGVVDGEDNCLTLYNPEQMDGDADGAGNSCDNCPHTANSDQLDSDRDNWGDMCDACPHDRRYVSDDEVEMCADVGEPFHLRILRTVMVESALADNEYTKSYGNAVRVLGNMTPTGDAGVMVASGMISDLYAGVVTITAVHDNLTTRDMGRIFSENHIDDDGCDPPMNDCLGKRDRSFGYATAVVHLPDALLLVSGGAGYTLHAIELDPYTGWKRYDDRDNPLEKRIIDIRDIGDTEESDKHLIYEVASLGDIDGEDGAAHVIATGERYYDVSNSQNTGRVRLHFFDNEFKIIESRIRQIDFPYLDPDNPAWHGFGAGIVALPQLHTADEGATVAISVLDTSPGTDSLDKYGALYIFALDKYGAVLHEPIIIDKGHPVAGEYIENGAGFGNDVINLGDLDGAGGYATYLAVGAPYPPEEAGAWARQYGRIIILALDEHAEVGDAHVIDEFSENGFYGDYMGLYIDSFSIGDRTFIVGGTGSGKQVYIMELQ